MKIRDNRFVILSVGTLCLAALGVLYCWSVFIPSLEGEFGASRSEVSFVFSVTMVMWSFGMLAAGWLSKKLPLKACFVLGFCLVVGGFVASSQVQGVAVLYLTYGGFCGFGIGLSYNLWMSYILKFFPDHIGAASGVLLLGFGLGSMILSAVTSILVVGPLGWRGTFLFVAVLIVMLSLVGLVFVKQPMPTDEKTSTSVDRISTDAAARKREETPVVRQGSFWAFTVWKVLVMGSAAAVIAQSSVLIEAAGAQVVFAAAAVGAINLGNAFGRLIAGFLFDRLGQGRMMIALPIGGLIAGFGLVGSYALLAPVALVFFLLLEGLVYGAYANLNVAFIRNTYGQKFLTTNMGVSSFTLMPFNLVFPVIAALVFDVTGGYFYFLLALPMIAGVSFVAGCLVNRALRK